MHDVPPILTVQYIGFVFLASLGTLQLAGARSGRRDVRLLRGTGATALLGAGLIAAAYVVFFSQARYWVRGLEGAQLFGYFGLGALAARLACAAVATVRYRHTSTAGRRVMSRVRASAAELRPTGRRVSGIRARDEAP
jgi:hypothetical protein